MGDRVHRVKKVLRKQKFLLTNPLKYDTIRVSMRETSKPSSGVKCCFIGVQLGQRRGFTATKQVKGVL
jgi:hypothetical protein